MVKFIVNAQYVQMYVLSFDTLLSNSREWHEENGNLIFCTLKHT